MPPVEIAGAPIVPDLGRESVVDACSMSASGADDGMHPSPWPAIGDAQWRSLKRSIVSAGACGAITPERAEGMIRRFGLQEI